MLRAESGQAQQAARPGWRGGLARGAPMAACFAMLAAAAACSSAPGPQQPTASAAPSSSAAAPTTPASPAGQPTASYFLLTGTDVELITLLVNGKKITGTVTDQYNCGNGSGRGSAPRLVTGRVVNPHTLHLAFAGSKGTFVGAVNSGGILLTAPTGQSVEFALVTPSNTVQATLATLPPISSISAYSCRRLPPFSGP